MFDQAAALMLTGVIGCVAVILCLSLAEAALIATPELSVRRLAEQGDRRALILRKLLEEGHYLSAIIVGVNACVLAAATLATLLVRRVQGGAGGWHEELWHVGIVAVILVVAELTPKTYGTLFALRVSLRVARPVLALSRALSPIVTVLTGIGRGILRIAGQPAAKRQHFITAGEIQAAADLGEEEGVVEREEGEMLDSVIGLGEQTAHDIMTPRVDVVAVSDGASLDHVIEVALESGFSRIPVYAGSLDSIVGIAYVNDLLHHLRQGLTNVSLKDIVREPFLVPETMRLDDLFRQLRERTVHIAVVVDEFGGTEGVVSVEDILEELVGEIADEHDREGDEIELLGPDEALVSAKARISEVNEALGIRLPEDDYSTLGGLVTGVLGRIPQEDESLEIEGIRLLIAESDEQHVSRIRIVTTKREGGEG